jgi:hypothetical protein
LIQWLAKHDKYGLGGNFLEETRVRGASGPLADLLILAWNHDGAIELLAEPLAGMSDAELMILRKKLGSLCAPSTAEALASVRAEIEGLALGVKAFRRVLREECERPEPNLERLAAEVGSWDKGPPQWIARTLERKQRVRERTLTRYRWALDLAEHCPQALKHATAAHLIREYVEEHVLRKRRLPNAKHDFGTIRTGPRSGVNIGAVDFESLFREHEMINASPELDGEPTRRAPSSFRMEFLEGNTDEWVTNGLSFPTRLEAEEYAADFSARWSSMVREHRIVGSNEPPNRCWMKDQIFVLRPAPPGIQEPN